MTSQPFIAIRLVPESPVDGSTFGTYLDDPSLEVVDANTGNTISSRAFTSPLTVVQWPPGAGSYVTIASEVTSADTPYHKSSNKYDYGDVLKIDSLDGISIGLFVLSADQTTIPASANGNSGLKVTPEVSFRFSVMETLYARLHERRGHHGPVPGRLPLGPDRHHHLRLRRRAARPSEAEDEQFHDLRPPPDIGRPNENFNCGLRPE